jgi:hypothetical protein
VQLSLQLTYLVATVIFIANIHAFLTGLL